MKKLITLLILGLLFSFTSTAQCDLTFDPVNATYTAGTEYSIIICYKDYSAGFPQYSKADWTDGMGNALVEVTGAVEGSTVVEPLGSGLTLEDAYCIRVTFTAGLPNIIAIEATAEGLSPVCGVTETNTYANIPIILESFEVTETDNTALFNWVTLSETNFGYFEVEMSLDGKEFKSIGKVKGSGNSRDRIEYSFSYFIPDYIKNSPFVYFRLKQNDLDGLYSYSDVILLNNNSKDKEFFALLDAYYDKSNINLNLTAMEKGVIQTRITNLNGQTLLIKEVDVREGINSLILPFNSTSGIYLLQVMNKNKIETKKIFIN